MHLGATDPDDAESFYTVLFGWEYDDKDMSNGFIYSRAKKGDAYTSAIYPLRAVRVGGVSI